MSGLVFSFRRLFARSSNTSRRASGGGPSHSTWVEIQGFGGFETGCATRAQDSGGALLAWAGARSQRRNSISPSGSR